MIREIKQKADELVELFVQYTPAENPFEYEYAVKIAILHQKRLIEVLEEFVDYKRDEFEIVLELSEQKAILTELQSRL